MNVNEAIETSITENRTVDFDGTMQDARFADGYEDNDGAQAWGTDEDGNEWQVRPTIIRLIFSPALVEDNHITESQIEVLKVQIDEIAADNVDRSVVLKECLDKWREQNESGEARHYELMGRYTKSGNPFIFG